MPSSTKPMPMRSSRMPGLSTGSRDSSFLYSAFEPRLVEPEFELLFLAAFRALNTTSMHMA